MSLGENRELPSWQAVRRLVWTFVILCSFASRPWLICHLKANAKWDVYKRGPTSVAYFLQTFFFKQIIFLSTTLTNSDNCRLNVRLSAWHSGSVLTSDTLKNRTHIKIKDGTFFFIWSWAAKVFEQIFFFFHATAPGPSFLPSSCQLPPIDFDISGKPSWRSSCLHTNMRARAGSHGASRNSGVTHGHMMPTPDPRGLAHLVEKQQWFHYIAEITGAKVTPSCVGVRCSGVSKRWCVLLKHVLKYGRACQKQSVRAFLPHATCVCPCVRALVWIHIQICHVRWRAATITLPSPPPFPSLAHD